MCHGMSSMLIEAIYDEMDDNVTASPGDMTIDEKGQLLLFNNDGWESINFDYSPFAEGDMYVDCSTNTITYDYIKLDEDKHETAYDKAMKGV